MDNDGQGELAGVAQVELQLTFQQRTPCLTGQQVIEERIRRLRGVVVENQHHHDSTNLVCNSMTLT